jgi:hypothetical protein
MRVPLRDLFKKVFITEDVEVKENAREIVEDGKEESLLEMVKTIHTTYFVPISTAVGKPYSEKWTEKDYLNNVKNFGCNEVFITEITEGLKELRDLRDKSFTYDELVEYAKASIEQYKKLLTLSYRAEKALIDLDAIKKDQGEPSFEC